EPLVTEQLFTSVALTESVPVAAADAAAAQRQRTAVSANTSFLIVCLSLCFEEAEKNTAFIKCKASHRPSRSPRSPVLRGRIDTARRLPVSRRLDTGPA